MVTIPLLLLMSTQQNESRHIVKVKLYSLIAIRKTNLIPSPSLLTWHYILGLSYN